MKTKDSREADRASLILLTVKNAQKSCVHMGTKISGEFQKTMQSGRSRRLLYNQTKTVFAQPTIQSLENVLAKPLYGRLWPHKL